MRSICFASAFAVLFFSISICAQSSLQDHPTPITRNEIEATVKARDVGDARVTTHYYWFDGAQGDVFVNWTSKNFAGDVDLFVQNGLRSLSKIVVYADFGEVETGRVIYLRKPERILLRVQGRTPNDDPASYRLKFAGSFVAAAGDEKDVPVMPTVGENLSGSVRVNSVGTIIQPPKPVETMPHAGAAPLAAAEKSDAEKRAEEKATRIEERTDGSKLEVVVEDPVKKEPVSKSASPNRNSRRGRTASKPPVKKADPAVREAAATGPTPDRKEITAVTRDEDAQNDRKIDAESKDEKANDPKSNPKADPLANVQLVIMFKDGGKIERPLPDVFRFSVDRGVLTVISKDGRVGKYQMIDVAKVTIQ